MNWRLLILLLAAGALALSFSCGKKNSDESCVHQVSMDLDAGNYDAVLASSCADAMQIGAAYFGRAGYDTTAVINRFIQTGASSSQAGGKSSLTTYMTDLIGVVNERSLSDLDSSTASFDSVPADAENYRDAQFNSGLVNMIKSLSLLKLVVSDVTGTINLSCDINANKTADGAEAESCTLIAANNISTNATATCKNDTTYARSTPIDITFAGKSGHYSGLVVALSGTAAPSCPADYRKLLYRTPSGSYLAVATSADQQCIGKEDGISWPCPVEVNGQPLDLVAAIDASLSSSVSSVNSSLTTSGTSNVQTSITSVKSQACPTTCTSTSVANYLLTIKK